MARAIAIANNDVVQIVWQYDRLIRDCLGFEVSRQQDGAAPGGKWVALPAWVGFKGQKNPTWTASTTTVWPIQKFQWKDLTARRGETFGYRIVPMVGKPGKLNPLLSQARSIRNR